MRTLATLVSLLGGVALASIFGTIEDARAQRTNCTSYVYGNTIDTNCSTSPRMGFTSFPALQVQTIDIPAIMEQAERRRALMLQNQLLQQQLQQLQQQRRQPSCPAGVWPC